MYRFYNKQLFNNSKHVIDMHVHEFAHKQLVWLAVNDDPAKLVSDVAMNLVL